MCTAIQIAYIIKQNQWMGIRPQSGCKYAVGAKSNHHYIPQFYLRAFADGYKRKAKVYAIDLEQKKSFKTLVRNVGSRRHFNRVEIDGVCPNFVEDVTAEIEALIAPHVANIIEEQRFPTADHKTSLLHLMSNTAARNPRIRGNLEEFRIRVTKKLLSVLTATEARWQSEIDKLKAEGFPFKKEVSYEEVRRLVEEDKLEFAVDQTVLISHELKAAEVVFEELKKRNWCFIKPTANNFFITSDNPTSLVWSDRHRSGAWPPGYAVRKTTVFFPISTSLMLVGTFEALPEYMDFSDFQIAQANSVTARHATSQIYAQDGSFEVSMAGGRMITGYDLPDFLISQNSRV